MTVTADVVVAGAGHNSLVTAAYLARAGYEVLVLEARPVVGGNTATEELTLPGFLHDSCSTAHNLIQASPALRELGLEEYGLEYVHPDPVVHIPFPDGTWLTQWRDLDRTCEEFAKFSRRDADAYRRLIAEYDAAKGAFGAYRNNPVGRAPRPEECPDGRWRRRLAHEGLGRRPQPSSRTSTRGPSCSGWRHDRAAGRSPGHRSSSPTHSPTGASSTAGRSRAGARPRSRSRSRG